MELTFRVDLAAPKIIKFGMESKWSSKVASTQKLRIALIQAMRDMRKICEQGQMGASSIKGKL